MFHVSLLWCHDDVGSVFSHVVGKFIQVATIPTQISIDYVTTVDIISELFVRELKQFVECLPIFTVVVVVNDEKVMLVEHFIFICVFIECNDFSSRQEAQQRCEN